ncbi:TPA: type II secretion system minor pseudopilin GspI [Stenotrophomonas maltophilia]|uniref:Type II secretion system protein I n=1 Tax=Stenotrophomonas maltophilia TaxID=40324 RepID=A0A2J0UC50_STEMA|nr:MULTISPECIES: type II secretion system minor pseudopilin GspI [Stenotrophomonas]PJL29007.1 type II secretion system protein GspI [Stenotrophomonas maltophilia]HDS1138358.1 type II secretion system minor pseudopilin GspI [Stenotrophomonas maltophilia]HDS1146151.1 type II secretion system minor pseudopilin GspI [Stenotrophomonas maltophilia]HDS1163443.1 type II secretion system minor pseudopilin GspI [Stenotrophomonas maltophilia]HEL5400533.1 type II secretion system minor pseudopilin GspI [S
MKRNARGFTLIEVLIALAIVSIALAAVMRSVAVATDDQSRLRDRRLALLCAQDRWQELRLAGQPPQEGRQRCVQGRSGFLVLQHLGTGDDGQPQLELSVVAEDAPRQSLARMQLPWTAAR